MGGWSVGAQEIEGRREYYLMKIKNAEDQIAKATDPQTREDWEKVAESYRTSLRHINFKNDTG